MTTLNSSLFDGLIAVLFVVGISAPMVKSLVEPDLEISKAEKRSLAQWPRWSDVETPKKHFNLLSTYASDQFGFRENLINLNTQLKWTLGYSPSAKVIRGRDDWLFLKIRDPLLSQHEFGLKAVEEGLKGRAEYVRTMQTNLGDRGIAYQLIVAPNKMNIYEEYLPAKFSLTNIRASYDRYKDQFAAEELEKQVFAEQVLQQQKANYTEDLYFKNDTHWNDLGAYLVFKESLSKLNREHSSLKFDAPDKKFSLKRKQTGDLADYLSLGNRLTSLEPTTNFRKCAARGGITAFRNGVNQSICNRNSTVLLMIGDSFMGYLMPYYSESVGKVYIVRQDISRRQLAGLIDELEPAVVIEQIVERSLPGKVP